MPNYVPRERKHKRRIKQNAPNNDATDHSNVESAVQIPEAEKNERRQQLRAGLIAQLPKGKATSKKRKRLDKYIETKLKKDENHELLKKLAAHKVDTSLLLSAKKLGRGYESSREKLQQALRERDAGIDVRGDQNDILYDRRQRHLGHDTAFEKAWTNEGTDRDDGDDKDENQTASRHIEVAAPHLFGSGLKQPLNIDENGRPIFIKRKRRKVTKAEIVSLANNKSGQGSYGELQADETLSGVDRADSEWNSFESESGEQEELVSDSVNSASESNANSVESVEPSDDEGFRDEKPGRLSAFKAWADKQRNQALDFTPSAVPINDASARAAFRPRALSPGPDLSELDTTISKSSYRPAAVVIIPRSETVQSARLNLPIVQDEQKIMEAVHSNPTVLICGATGSGKTTQLPQMLFENGYASTGMIGVTQPRRLAATSVASRVAHELGSEYGKHVAYQVRYDTDVNRETRIKFMTDGILLREISQDFALAKYSAIIVDEAHERSVNTDILIGILSRIVPLRTELSREEPHKFQPLKLIIMSATLRVTDFILNDRLFRKEKPPVIQAEGRQYPVTEHFSRRTQRDYIAETVKKVSRGHRRLPPGGILVFLTGQDEIHTVARRLREAFAGQKTGSRSDTRSAVAKSCPDYYEQDSEISDTEPEIVGFDDEDDYDAEFEVDGNGPLPSQRSSLEAKILSLYAALPANQQAKIFEIPPDNVRPIILATNVAETSLTIPGIRYVFDCGRSKERRYNTASGVQEFHIDWISKANASQRMGRAGRTGPGHCYRLYSSAVFEQYFAEHSSPEILRVPIEGTVLQLKDMDIDNVVGFPFLTAPHDEQLIEAEGLLRNIGAIDARKGTINDVGKELLKYPVNPRFGKMLLLGLQNNILVHTIALVAGLAVGDLFISEPSIRPGNTTRNESDSSGVGEHESSSDNESTIDAAALNATNRQKQAYGRVQANLSGWDDRADAIKLLTAVAAHADQDDKKAFCIDYFLKEKAMEEVQQLRLQLHKIMNVPFTAVPSDPKKQEISKLKQVVAAGFIDQVAIRADILSSVVRSGRKPRRAIEVAYRTLLPSISESEVDRTAPLEQQMQRRSVYVHSGSILARLSPDEMPLYVVYSTLSCSTSGNAKFKRTRMHPLTAIGPKQLATLAEGTPLLELGKPLGTQVRAMDGGRRRECWVSVSLRNPNAVGSTGWPLPAWKVIQARDGKEWTVEKVLDRGNEASQV